MKISDVLTEAGPATAPSNVGRDYINMLNFVKSSGLEGVPADQQVAVALFKELQKQQQKNTQLGRELSAAEKRIDQATQSGDMYGQELATHQAELERERGEIERQQEKMGQIDQQYASRAQASEQQMRSLTDKLEQLKSKPGVDKSTAETLQNQIEKLRKEGVDKEKYQELQKNIESIQNMQQVDDRVIQDLVAQVKDAQQASQELQKTRQTVGKDAEETAQRALDQVEQIKQQLKHFQDVEAQTALLNQQVNKLAQAQNVLSKQTGKMQAAPTTADMAKDEIAKQGAATMLTPAEPSPQMRLPGIENTPPATGNQIELPGLDQPESEPDRYKNIVGRVKQANPVDVAAVYESQMARAIAWATGRTK
jgi:chromosome segregation ATPase